MKLYLGKDRQRTAQHVISNPCDSDGTDEEDRRKWPQIIQDNFFSSPKLFDDLLKKELYGCGTVRPNRKGMPKHLKPKTTKLKGETFALEPGLT